MTQADTRWHAVESRDSASDGKFVYAVQTTRIYCRPACPSRLPLRRNVAFFDTTEAAAAAGFRACKRCTPDGPLPVSIRNAALENARARLNESPAPSLTELAQTAGLSKFHFHRLFRQAYGVTPLQYIRNARVTKARAGLRTADSVTAAIYEAGFNSSARFYETVPASLGMHPRQYRNSGEGLTIEYAFMKTWIGTVLAAATPRGLCSVAIGDSETTLLENLRNEFPAAELREADTSFADIAALASRTLDPAGTAFQRKVWRALTGIRPGTTTSYSELARVIGQPGAARAVASACAANPLAIVVPCHRVVRSDGALSGYRWGAERKKRLLEKECQDTRL